MQKLKKIQDAFNLFIVQDVSNLFIDENCSKVDVKTEHLSRQ